MGGAVGGAYSFKRWPSICVERAAGGVSQWRWHRMVCVTMSKLCSRRDSCGGV
jgi:hypothetical protein